MDDAPSEVESERPRTEEVMERHVDKASRGENGERRVTATSEEPPPPRRSARESVLSAQGKVTKVEPMRKRDLPEASEDLLRVLKDGSIGADDEQLGTVDELSEDSRVALLAWWPKMREGSETKQRLFSAWFRGKPETKCLGNQAITKAKSVFEHGAGFACRACASQSRPCLALKRVDEKELLVAVRPSREEDGGRSFSYWQKPK